MRRNSAYMRFQRLQLCSIERVLPECFMTFTKMYKAFDNNEEVHFSWIQETFKTKIESANKLEGVLPLIIAVSWFVVAVSCVAFLIHMFILS
jgi:hypothetical protein